MKKKMLKRIAVITALVLMAGLLVFANALLGNPVSKALAKNAAKKYVETTYEDKDFYVEEVHYNFKDGEYIALIKSPTSIDSHFTIDISMLGKVTLDRYADVISGFNTATRLETEYREIVDQVLTSPSYPYDHYIGFGTLEVFGDVSADKNYPYEDPVYGLNVSDLVIDKIYDIRKLGSEVGHLVLYVEEDDVSVERAGEILLDITKHFDDAELPFKAISLVLQYKKPEEGMRPEGEIRLEQFSYEDIYEEGLLERITRADEEIKAYYERLDAEK